MKRILFFVLLILSEGKICSGNYPSGERKISLKRVYLDAALNGYTDLLKKCIEEGVDRNARDGESRTALMLACWNGHVNAIEYLVALEGLIISETDDQGRTAISYANAWQIKTKSEVNIMKFLKYVIPSKQDLKARNNRYLLIDLIEDFE